MPYRREQQSCNAFFAELPGGDPSQRLIRYVVDHTNGRPPRRALVCAPGETSSPAFGWPNGKEGGNVQAVGSCQPNMCNTWNAEPLFDGSPIPCLAP